MLHEPLAVVVMEINREREAEDFHRRREPAEFHPVFLGRNEDLRSARSRLPA